MKIYQFAILFLLTYQTGFSQPLEDSIHTDFVLHDNRVKFKTYLIDKTVDQTFTVPLDSNSEYDYEDACWSISQFALQSPQVETGFAKMFNQFYSLQYPTRRAFLEAVYASYPHKYEKEFQSLLEKETYAKLFAMEALYLYRDDPTFPDVRNIENQMVQKFPGYDSIVLLDQLRDYLENHQHYLTQPTPDIRSLFVNQRVLNQKIIYSFQRWNRDYPGLAIVQNSDGSFVRDSTGKLITIEQLARSGSNLPFFITNGNTPQGIFSIQGILVDQNHIIGPTPTIQLVMPFEADTVYWHNGYDSSKDELTNYLGLLPEAWKSYNPMKEAFYAGKAGRTEIISHGTTLDPAYFFGKPFYPISPTMGCLCAREDWNIFTGKLNSSDQLKLVQAFLSTAGDKGYLMVINLDNQQKAVSVSEVENLVNQFEKKPN